MSKRYKRRRRARYAVRCTIPGCRKPGRPCFLNSWDKEPEEILCTSHIQYSGYCRSCGQFWGGVESFDFGRSPGICEFCRDQHCDDCPEPEPEDLDSLTPDECETEALTTDY